MQSEQMLNDIAARIKQRRIDLNLSLQAVADAADMSKSTLQRYETGSIKNIPLKKLDDLARALNTSADWLLGLTENAEDVTPLDVDFKRVLRSLGFQLQAWPGYSSRIYFSGDIGMGQITKEEYEQLRDNFSAYVKFNATNLLKLAVDRETKREKYELKKWKAFGDAIKEGKSCNDAFIAGLRATDNPTSEDE